MSRSMVILTHNLFHFCKIFLQFILVCNYNNTNQPTSSLRKSQNSLKVIMSLSQKSKYVPPHLRAKSDPNTQVIVVNPDDEMPPKSPPGLRTKSMPLNRSPNDHYHRRMQPQYIHQQRSANYRSPPKVHVINEDWRSSQPTEQPEFNLDAMDDDYQQQRSRQRGAPLDHAPHQQYQQNNPENSNLYHSNVRQFGHAQRGRYQPQQSNRHPQRQQQQQQQQPMDDMSDPNELLFAKIEQNEQLQPNCVQSDENADDNHQNTKQSRYNRQYVVKHDNAQKQQQQNENGHGDNMPPHQNNGQYELASTFQTLAVTKAPTQSLRRRRRNSRNQAKVDQQKQNAIATTSNQKGKNRQNNSKSNSPSNTSTKKRKNKNLVVDRRSSSKNVNVVSSAAPAPINWAAQLKGKKAKVTTKKRQPSGKSVSIGSNSGSSNDFDSSQGACVDADKVRHVLEVFNMTPADYQRVSGIFKHFKIDTFVNSLICVKKRWFVVFDCAKSAVDALNIVKNDRFKLKRIDLNVKDVQMLKNNVPPPLRKSK